MSSTPDPNTVPEPNEAPQPDAPPAGDAGSEERTYGMLCHLLALAGFLIPLGNIIGPVIIWMIKKEESEYVDYHGKESLNFQITVTLAMIVSFLLAFVFIGILLMPVIGIAALILIIIAAIKAKDGKRYRYPFCLRLIK